MKIFLLCLLGFVFGFGNGAEELRPEQVAALKGKTLLNREEVRGYVNFENIEVDPYPKLWYDTHIVRDRDCYVVYRDASRQEYELKNLNSQEAAGLDAHLTHKGGCGVCSNLDDLHVYYTQRDLTGPVRKCALKFIKSWTISCLKDLGFTEDCAMIWYWNTQNTRKPSHKGGCFGVCFLHIFTANNIPSGTYNPCRPLESVSSLNTLNDENVPDLSESFTSPATGRLCLPAGPIGKNVFFGSRIKDDTGLCGNTINHRPACDENQWKDGVHRLNPCLQCDECRSGPIFQKVAGRTRRNSGIHSAIDRPGVATDVIHNYGLPVEITQ